jgi:hypothetical protein
MLPHFVFIGGDIHAVNFIVGDIALLPYHLRAHLSKYITRLDGNALKFSSRQLARSWKVSFNYILWHDG